MRVGKERERGRGRGRFRRGGRSATRRGTCGMENERRGRGGGGGGNAERAGTAALCAVEAAGAHGSGELREGGRDAAAGEWEDEPESAGGSGGGGAVRAGDGSGADGSGTEVGGDVGRSSEG